MTQQVKQNNSYNSVSEQDKKFIEALTFILDSKSKAEAIHTFLRMPETILPVDDPVRDSIKKMVDKLIELRY